MRAIILSLTAILTLATSALHAQSFDFASVKRYASRSSGAHSAPDVIDLYRPTSITRIQYNHVSLKSIVMAAYGVNKDQVAGPPWLGNEYYDIVANPPPDALWDQVPAMLQNLLTERFHMTVHRGTIARKGFALLVDKGGPKLAAAQPAVHPALDIGSGYFRFRDYSVTELARLLSIFMGRPIVDRTEIQGSYDFTLKAYATDLKVATAVGGNTMTAVSDALRDLGLKLESGMVPAPNVVIDKADRIPTAD